VNEDGRITILPTWQFLSLLLAVNDPLIADKNQHEWKIDDLMI